MPPHYGCPRCGYDTDKLGNYKNHLKRKAGCKPVKADIVPTAENVVRLDAAVEAGVPREAPVAPPARDTQPTADAAHPTTVNNITNVTNVTNHVTNNIINISLTCPTGPVPYGQSTLEHIKPETWVKLAHVAQHNPDLAGMLLTQYIHFDPAVPQNHNLFFPDMSKSAFAACFKRGYKDPEVKWRWQPREQLLEDLLDSRIADIQEYRQSNPHVVGHDASAEDLLVSSDTRGERGVYDVMTHMVTFGSEVVVVSSAQSVRSIMRECPDRDRE